MWKMQSYFALLNVNLEVGRHLVRIHLGKHVAGTAVPLGLTSLTCLPSAKQMARRTEMGKALVLMDVSGKIIQELLTAS